MAGAREAALAEGAGAASAGARFPVLAQAALKSTTSAAAGQGDGRDSSTIGSLYPIGAPGLGRAPRRRRRGPDTGATGDNVRQWLRSSSVCSSSSSRWARPPSTGSSSRAASNEGWPTGSISTATRATVSVDRPPDTELRPARMGSLLPVATDSRLRARTGSRRPARMGSLHPARMGSLLPATDSHLLARTASRLRAHTGSRLPATGSRLPGGTGSRLPAMDSRLPVRTASHLRARRVSRLPAHMGSRLSVGMGNRPGVAGRMVRPPQASHCPLAPRSISRR
jgi:hypothetical protein